MEEPATYLGPKGYTVKKDNLPIEEQELIRKDLTVKPFVPKSSMARPTPFPVYRESSRKFYLPRFYGIRTYGPPEADIIGEGSPISLQFDGEMRPFQKPIVKKYLKCARKEGAGLLEIHCGAGKTCMALKIIAELSRKTFVIVHKMFLVRQWEERIKQFLPGARIGRVQGAIIDIEDKDIVIGMLQSLSMKSYPLALFKSFGLLIIDEVHHIGAEVFSRALFKIVTRYTLGLSATMKRKDGLTPVFKMFLGGVVYKKEREPSGNVVVRAICYTNSDPAFSHVILNFKGQTHYTLMIKKLCEFNRRSQFIIRVLTDALARDSKQQVMILAHNLSLLRYLYDAIEHRGIASVGWYVGGMKQAALNISEKKKIIVATYAMAEEALDIKTLSTLIMATPKADVRQAVGRILRRKDVKARVYDIVDQHDVFKRQWVKRRRWYNNQKFEVRITDMEGYANDSWETLSKGGKRSALEKEAPDPLLQGVCLLTDD